jgi:hypothetical protein
VEVLELEEGLSALLDQILNGVELIGDKDEPKLVGEAQLIDLLEETREQAHGFSSATVIVKVLPHRLANFLNHRANRIIHSLYVVTLLGKSFLNCLVEKRGMSGTKKTCHRKSKQT